MQTKTDHNSSHIFSAITAEGSEHMILSWHKRLQNNGNFSTGKVVLE